MSKPRQRTSRRSTRKTSDAVEILDAVLGNDPKARAAADKAYDDAVIAMMIYQARTRARMTQKQLADLIDSDQAVISRLEDANYRGHSLTMLRKIARALGKRLDIRFVDAA
ncbi:MAG: helix-turn-helix transcriptional regulator [Phycisphaeraceae bacterium]|nr:helix-turn-helix transcriptional regulator [Phycisphaeraceae bacterium]